MLYTGSFKIIKQIVLSLCLPLEGENYHLYMDRFYTSPSLFSKLKSLGFSVTGTVQRNRQKLNVEHLNLLQNLGTNKSRFFISDPYNLFLLGWKDKKLVTMLSTVYDTRF